MESLRDDVTLGEVYRLCQAIQLTVEKQNGRVGHLDDRVDALEKDAVRLKTLWIAATVVLGVFGGWLRKKMGLS